VIPRDVIVAEGPDTVKFLHSQLSQDIASMSPGEVRWSFLLQPTGKLVSLLRVVRHADGDGLSLDTDAGHGSAVVEALSRFKIRTKCELSLQPSVPFTATWSGRLPELAPAVGNNERPRIPGVGNGARCVDHPERHGTCRLRGEFHQGLLHRSGTRRANRLSRDQCAPAARRYRFRCGSSRWRTHR
jgi:tRNA-modifying protein YgfZ